MAVTPPNQLHVERHKHPAVEIRFWDAGACCPLLAPGWLVVLITKSRLLYEICLLAQEASPNPGEDVPSLPGTGTDQAETPKPREREANTA